MRVCQTGKPVEKLYPGVDPGVNEWQSLLSQVCSGIKSTFWFELHTQLSSFQWSWDQILRNKRDTLDYCSEMKLDAHTQKILGEWCVCQNTKVHSSNYMCGNVKKIFGIFMNCSSIECSTKKKTVRLCKLGVCWQAENRSTTYSTTSISCWRTDRI